MLIGFVMMIDFLIEFCGVINTLGENSRLVFYGSLEEE